MRPENLTKTAHALGVSCDYLLTGDIIDKDKLLLSEKLEEEKPCEEEDTHKALIITLFLLPRRKN